MRQRLSTVGVLLLVMVLVSVGMLGCARKAEERETEPTQEAAATGEPVSSGGAQPAPGETVVSAVTPSSGGSTQPSGEASQATQVAVGETPGAAEPAATPAGEATAAPSQPDTSGGTSGHVWHTVRAGETLSSIARRYGTTWQAIAQANGLSNPNQIYVSQKLKVPTSEGSSGGTSGGTAPGCRVQHTVKTGEWVWQIARDYGVSPYDILAANGMTIRTANTIFAGMTLCIP